MYVTFVLKKGTNRHAFINLYLCKECTGVGVWCSTEVASGHLYPISERLGCVPGPSAPTRFLLTHPGSQPMITRILRSLTHMGSGIGFGDSPRCGHLGSEPEGGKSLSLSLCLSNKMRTNTFIFQIISGFLNVSSCPKGRETGGKKPSQPLALFENAHRGQG